MLLNAFGDSTKSVDKSAGVTGIALAMAGARATLSDLPHITPLTQRNLENNVGVGQSYAQVSAAASAVAPWALQACKATDLTSQIRDVANTIPVQTWIMCRMGCRAIQVCLHASSFERRVCCTGGLS